MQFSDLPHKNIYLSSFAALVIITIGVLYNYAPSFFAKQATFEKTVLAIAATSTNHTAIDTRDSDHDSLPDWEEYLYGSDIANPDTDRDGTTDGDEVRAGRNPVIANTAKLGEEPNDKLKNLQDPRFSTSTTDISAKKKEFLIKYLEASGKDIRETTYRDLVSKFDATKFKPTQQLVDLNISSDNTDQGIRQFINSFGALVLRYKTPSAPRSETDIFKDFSKTQNAETLKDLHLSIIEYKNFAKDLRALSVPSSIAKTYLLIVGGYEGMALGLSGLAEMKTNPINAAGGYEGYAIYRVQVANGFVAIINELKKRNLTFAKDEPGYMFYTNVFARPK